MLIIGIWSHDTDEINYVCEKHRRGCRDDLWCGRSSWWCGDDDRQAAMTLLSTTWRGLSENVACLPGVVDYVEI